MNQLYAGRTEDFADGVRRLVAFQDYEIGVWRERGEFVAYRNQCLHQGGPVCEGAIIGRVEAILDDKRHVLGERFSSEERHLVCPWHGWEYDVRTGECAGKRGWYLERYDVLERDGTVYVLVASSENDTAAIGR